MKIVSFDFFTAASPLARANLPYQPIVANLNRKQRYLSHRYSKLESNNLPRNGILGSDSDMSMLMLKDTGRVGLDQLTSPKALTERKTSKKLSLLKKELGIESQEDKRMQKKYICRASRAECTMVQ